MKLLIIFLAIIVFPVISSAQNYQVGVIVKDTLAEGGTGQTLNFINEQTYSVQGFEDYVAGLNFVVEFISAHDVYTNVSDTVNTGDKFVLPVQSPSGALKVFIPPNSSFSVRITLEGTPIIAGEKYYCNLTVLTTLNLFFKSTSIFYSDDSLCTVQVNEVECSCLGKKDVINEYNSSDAVFSGTVTEVLSDSINQIQRIDLDIIESWKGIDTSNIRISTPFTNSCGYSFEENKSYLVYAVKTTPDSLADTLWTGSCMRTAELFDATEDLEILGSGILGINREDVMPVSYNLSQNYPNPFNPTTKIIYSLRRADMVQLRVYDILGREMKTLVNSHQQAGFHEIVLAIHKSELEWKEI